MSKGKYQVVLDDDLFKDFHKFKNGEKLEKEEVERIKCLLHYFKGDLITNIAQYERTGLPLTPEMKKTLAKNGLKQQTKEELAQSRTMYKVILCCGCSDFPYVNVTSDKEKIENNLSSFYDIAERRDKAIKHLGALCSGAKKIVVYDRYFDVEPSKEVRNIETLVKILPQKKLTILFSNISQNGIKSLTEKCAEWNPQLDTTLKGHHDRYIIIDEKLEIVLSSGFDHLSADSSDFMYIVRVTDKSRF
ncbi:MAG: hypothetical protein K5757_00660 [Bacteroidaceae bacterium]|nr:hypothetical protein [Bacteroidaceae bacterium]